VVLISLAGKPFIVVHPCSQQVKLGQEFSLCIEVAASPQPCSFHWYKNHAKMEGQVGSKLVLPAAKLSDAAEYYCSVANSAGFADSEIAFVTVLDPRPPPSSVPQAQWQYQSQADPLPEDRMSLQSYGGYPYPQQQQFPVQGPPSLGDYMVQPFREPQLIVVHPNRDYRQYQQLPPDWEYRREIHVSAEDEDRPGGQGEGGRSVVSEFSVEGAGERGTKGASFGTVVAEKQEEAAVGGGGGWFGGIKSLTVLVVSLLGSG